MHVQEIKSNQFTSVQKHALLHYMASRLLRECHHSLGDQINSWRLSLSGLYNMLPSQIVMYATQYCSDCHRSTAFFEADKIGYLNVNLEGNEETMQFVMTLNNGYRSVPTIIFPDGFILVEPSWDQLEAKTKDK